MPEPTISDFYSQMVNDPFFTASEGQTKEETARILAHNRFRQQKNNEIALSFTKQIATDIANEIFKQMRHPNPGKQHLTWNPSTHRWVKRQTAAAGKAAVGETKPEKAHPKKAKGKTEPVTPRGKNVAKSGYGHYELPDDLHSANPIARVKKEEKQPFDQIKMDHYVTKNFDICPSAIAAFQKLLKVKEPSTRNKILRAMKMNDDFLGIEKKVVEKGFSTDDDINDMVKLMGKSQNLIGEIEKEIGTNLDSDFEYTPNHVAVVLRFFKDDKPKKKNHDKVDKSEEKMEDPEPLKNRRIRQLSEWLDKWVDKVTRGMEFNHETRRWSKPRNRN